MDSRERDRPWWLLPPMRLSGTWWLLIAATMLGVEYSTGLYREFPVVYFVPVCLAAYYSGRWPALTLAVVIPLIHLVFALIDDQPDDPVTLVAMTVVRGGVITFMALWFVRLSEHEQALHHEVQTLKGLLPICSFCKSIRNDAGEWERLERFISRRSETKFSHGICPTCERTHYAEGAGSDARSY